MSEHCQPVRCGSATVVGPEVRQIPAKNGAPANVEGARLCAASAAWAAQEAAELVVAGCGAAEGAGGVVEEEGGEGSGLDPSRGDS